MSISRNELMTSPAAPRHPSTSRAASSSTVPISNPARPQPARSGSSFSNFFRKLTGKSSKSPSPSPAPNLASSGSSAPRSPGSRASTMRSIPQGVNRPPHQSFDGRESSSSAFSGERSQPRTAQDMAGPSGSLATSGTSLNAPSEVSPSKPKSTLLPSDDPCSIPLPASPLPSTSEMLHQHDVPMTEQPARESGPETEVKAAKSTSADVQPKKNTNDMVSGPSVKEIRQVGLLRLEIPGSQSAVKRSVGESVREEENEEEDEEEDVISPLPSLERTAGSDVSSDSQEIVTPSSANTELEPTILRQNGSPSSAPLLSPLSPSGLAPRQSVRVVSQSPPKKVMSGGTSPVDVGLGRKSSKWRKSMMNISEVSCASGPSSRIAPRWIWMLTNQTLKPEQKRVSKSPPSSFDAYQAHQQRLSQNRKSCSPTTHTAGTIFRDIQEIRDKEEREMAESFFMS